MAVDKEKIEELEKNINKRIIRIVIWWVLIFEKYPIAVEWSKKQWKKVYLHLMEQYENFKKDFLK
jgi:hypothetical protein